MRSWIPVFAYVAILASLGCARPAETEVQVPRCVSTAAPPAVSTDRVTSPPSLPKSAPEAENMAGPPPIPLTPPAPAPLAFQQAITGATHALSAGDYSGADRQLDAAASSAGDNLHLRYVVARYRATRFAYAGDFEAAATALVAVIPELAKHPESADEFWAHNGMMMIREASGDPAGALAEDDQATIAAARGSWEPANRETLAYLKDRWHRAYLTRMLAEERTGSAHRALVQYAEAALDDYRARARKLGTNEDSIAVLEAYFAALDGRREAALAAAKRVDPAKDDDIEDLYLVVVGLEAGGDHAAAEAVRRRMRQPGSVHLGRPIMLRWLDHDAKTPRDHVFTPWHAG